MRISTRLPTRHILNAALLCLLAGLAWLPASAHGQVLAQKNWAGSGVTVEVWWKRAVFYRIDPTKFQDSTGSGKGDLAGIGQRLDYLQSLGVDAVIVETAPGGGKATLLPTPEVSTAFDALVRDAVARHVRILVNLGAPASQQADAEYVQLARAWMNQGAAGIFCSTPELEKVDGGSHIALLLQQLRALTDSFPGGRVLLATEPSQQDAMLESALAKYAQLTASAPLGAGAMSSVAALRQEWMEDLGDTSAPAGATPAATNPTANPPAAAAGMHGRERRDSALRSQGSKKQALEDPLLLAVRIPGVANPAQRLAMERALAVMLLASRSAVLLEYGQELGLENAGRGDPLMQWTPTNLTRKGALPIAPVQPAVQPSGYKGFVPYVPPLPRNLFPPPVMPKVEEGDEPTPVDVSTLPGFTTGKFDASLAAANGATANVATESNDRGSLLNLYKQLIRLHHGNPTVRSGAQTVMDRDALGALVWVRHAPPSSRTSSTVVVACNLSDRPVVLSNLSGVPMRAVRSLLQPAVGDVMKVEPGAVVVAETR